MRQSQYMIALFAIMPVLAAIPYGSSLYTDEKTKYTYNILLRCEKKHYFWSKLITMFLSGGVIGAFPFVLSFLTNMALLPLDYVNPASGLSVSNTSFFSDIFYDNPVIYIF